jgi:hypothetical protein
VPSAAITVVHRPELARFEALVAGRVARADYRLEAGPGAGPGGGVMCIFHTAVPPAIEGRGVAAALIEAAFDYADAHGLKVAPQCSYVRVWLRRHPERERLRA